MAHSIINDSGFLFMAKALNRISLKRENQFFFVKL